MSIHVGKIIQAKVEELRLTQREFGDRINRNEKTVPNIYEREHMSTDLLLTIVEALNYDLLKHFYEDEPLKSLRNDEVAQLKNKVLELHEVIKQLQKEVAHKQELVETQKGYLSVVTEQLQEYKRKPGFDPENKS